MTASTRSLWPDDLKTEDVRTPVEILSEQAQLLEQQTNGLLQGNVVEQALEDRKVVAFEVTAPRIPQTVRLFEVYQSLELEYPARILPPELNIPGYLQSKVYQPGMLESSMVGRWEKQEWVAESPAEFTKKLEQVLASGSVKAILYKLLARSKRTNGDTGQSESAA